MKILFICKASVNIGLGHLIRSRSLAVGLKKISDKIDIDFFLITNCNFNNFFPSPSFNFQVIDSEKKFVAAKKYDFVFIDLTQISNFLFLKIKNISKKTISLSPSFNMLKEVDILINRTKYLPQRRNLPKKIFAGLEYAIIQDDCQKIGAGLFEENLKSPNFPVAISMGGGDAANKTLKLIKILKKCSIPATFWVLLGEGYKFSYDDLIKEIKNNTHHEIILVNSNRSMWEILKNCLLLILPGGITSYESVYAGLPSINLLEEKNNYFLIKEIVDKKACLYGGEFNDKNLLKINSKIESLYDNKNELMEMHIKSKRLLDKKSFERIHDILHDNLETI